MSSNIPFIKSFIALIFFLLGLLVFHNGYQLMMFDERKLNQWVLSILLMVIGIYFVSEGLYLIGIKEFKVLQPAVIFFAGVVSVVSTYLVKEHAGRRDEIKLNRAIKKQLEYKDELEKNQNQNQNDYEK